MPTETLLQNPRDYTVQIRRASDGAIAGTGVVVSLDGRIVTCAHVVRACGVEPRTHRSAEVGVYFPQAPGTAPQERRATVWACFPDHDDDVVLLQLTGDDPAPLSPEQVAVLGDAVHSAGHEFRAYGYRRLDEYLAGLADGDIVGEVEPPPRRTLQADPVQLRSPEISRGMSGAGVLDKHRNLVVGLVTETWEPKADGKDRDTSWAVNARVLSLAPLSLALRDTPLPGRSAPVPQVTLPPAPTATGRRFLRDAPDPLAEWVGRADLLAALDTGWADPQRRLIGLIGFGGEGKSSLARQWLQRALDSEAPPEAVVWWGFYERRSVDEFAEELLRVLGSGLIDPRALPTTSLRLQVGAGLLRSARAVLVLDGLEVLQRPEGDDGYGLLHSTDLRAFLELLAGPGHGCFTLVTSRAPLFDLLTYPGYHQRDVERLSPADGRDLLRRLGVRGSDAALDAAVGAWDGHALTLSLIAAYLAEQHAGDVTHLGGVPPPTAEEGRYERVRRVLRRYDAHLGQAERAFLALFSAFRLPVRPDAFDTVFRGRVVAQPPFEIERLLEAFLLLEPGAVHPPQVEVRPSPLNAPVAVLDDAAFAAMLTRLTAARLLRRSEPEGVYTVHPLVRAHYLAALGVRGDTAAAHEAITDYYRAVAAGDMPEFPMLEQLQPWIEVVYHACQAGAYDEAAQVYWERLQQGQRRVLSAILGADETALQIVRSFFPPDDPVGEPLVSTPRVKSYLLNEVGLCLVSLGRLAEATPFYEHAVAVLQRQQEWANASSGYGNLAMLHLYLGDLVAGAQSADEALALARRAEDKQGERDIHCLQGWLAHLRGDVADASVAFAEAEVLEREIDPGMRSLYSLRGIWHAEYLRRTGNPVRAQAITEANLSICERNRWLFQISQCHRVLGELAGDVGERAEATTHLAEALRLARSISMREVLIAALLAQGRVAAQGGDAATAASALAEALDLARDGGYRLYEADIRVALAWLAHTRGEPDRARAETATAHAMSGAMGYHWGQVDADAVLQALAADGEA